LVGLFLSDWYSGLGPFFRDPWFSLLLSLPVVSDSLTLDSGLFFPVVFGEVLSQFQLEKIKKNIILCSDNKI